MSRSLLRRALLVGAVSGLTPALSAQLPPPPVPPENPITPAKTVLGKMLFWEEQLSSDGTVACATCHLPEFGGSDPRTRRTVGRDGLLGTADDVFGSPGVIRTDRDGVYRRDEEFGFGPQLTARFSPGFLMAAYADFLLWDGRADTVFRNPETGQVSIPWGGALESQAVEPLLSDVEMAHEGRHWADVTGALARSVPMALASELPADIQTALQGDPTYPDLFQDAFGDAAITAARIAFAIATYERSLIPDQTPWDLGTMTPRQAAGAQAFIQHRCISCHLIPFFSDGQFHNIGVRPIAEDPGRAEVTGLDSDRGRFRSPTVRNAALRPAFMHNGGMQDLMEVIEFYDRGGDFPENLDLSMTPLGLTDQEKGDLLEFMVGGLTDPRVAHGLPPFDHPTLYTRRTTRVPSKYGAFSSGRGGFFPRVIAVTPPYLGNPAFRLGVYDGLGGAPAFLVASSERAPPGTLWRGVPLNVDLEARLFLGTMTLKGIGPGQGHTTYQTALPFNPALAGETIYFQWLIQDDAAEGGMAASRGVRVRLF